MVTNISFEAECMISVKDDLLFLNFKWTVFQLRSCPEQGYSKSMK